MRLYVLLSLRVEGKKVEPGMLDQNGKKKKRGRFVRAHLPLVLCIRGVRRRKANHFIAKLPGEPHDWG
jgi:hypothetical protein